MADEYVIDQVEYVPGPVPAWPLTVDEERELLALTRVTIFEGPDDR